VARTDRAKSAVAVWNPWRASISLSLRSWLRSAKKFRQCENSLQCTAEQVQKVLVVWKKDLTC
jgi:hypothetical protein